MKTIYLRDEPEQDLLYSNLTTFRFYYILVAKFILILPSPQNAKSFYCFCIYSRVILRTAILIHWALYIINI